MRVDVPSHFGNRGSSSRAKKAEAVFKISLARPQLPVLLLQLDNPLLVRGRHARPEPLVDLSPLDQCRNVSEPIPSSRPTRVTTPWRSPVALMVSRTILIARSRSSGGYRCCEACFDG